MTLKGFPNCSTDFWDGRSTLTNLGLFTDFIEEHMERGKVDWRDLHRFCGSFLSCKLRHSVIKLQTLGIHGNLLKWNESYLSNSSQAVLMGGFKTGLYWNPFVGSIELAFRYAFLRCVHIRHLLMHQQGITWRVKCARLTQRWELLII